MTTFYQGQFNHFTLPSYAPGSAPWSTASSDSPAGGRKWEVRTAGGAVVVSSTVLIGAVSAASTDGLWLLDVTESGSSTLSAQVQIDRSDPNFAAGSYVLHFVVPADASGFHTVSQHVLVWPFTVAALPTLAAGNTLTLTGYPGGTETAATSTTVWALDADDGSSSFTKFDRFGADASGGWVVVQDDGGAMHVTPPVSLVGLAGAYNLHTYKSIAGTDTWFYGGFRVGAGSGGGVTNPPPTSRRKVCC